MCNFDMHQHCVFDMHSQKVLCAYSSHAVEEYMASAHGFEL